MWVVWLFGLFLFTAPASAEPGFSEKYERDYNIFNPANRYQPDNPLNPAQAYAPDNPFNPANRYDPGNPVNPAPASTSCFLCEMCIGSPLPV
jgi:hypothetical protein